MRTLQRTAPAKINLGLHVRGKRRDGYHDIETVFLRIGWSDVVRVEEANEFSMECTDPRLPTDSANTCVAAAGLLASRFGVRAGARIILDKRVPYGAGLGSGSSDAAATLLLLNELWGLDAPAVDLHEVAAAVGSDVPFFLRGPLAYAEGRGEQLTDLDCSSVLDRTSATILVPDVQIGSGYAYSLVAPHAEPRPDLREVVCKADLATWPSVLVNDFHGPILQRFPGPAAAKDILSAAGAEYVSLSGSGSAVFGLFTDESSAEAAARSGRASGMTAWVGAPTSQAD